MSTAARIDELRKKFEENPRRYFAPLANELRKAGDLTQAIALCREHLPKQPGHMSGYIVFGQALFESGELDEARSVFEQALALDPENLIALHHLGHIARQQGDAAGARRWYERALDADPRNDDIAQQLAMLATPVRSQPAVPTPAPGAIAVPPESVSTDEMAHELAFLDTGVLAPRRDLGAIPTPPYPQEAVGATFEALPLAPTPDASLRAVDFDAVNASLRHPQSQAFAEAEAIEALGNALAGVESSDEVRREEPPASSVPSPDPIDLSFDDEPVLAAPSVDLPLIDVSEDTDRELPLEVVAAEDPFAFSDEEVTSPSVPSTDVVDLEAAFEEGLLTAGWSDATEMATRAATPRYATPVSVEVPASAAEAFGLEPDDDVQASLPEPEPEVLGDEADLLLPTPVPDGQDSLPWLPASDSPDDDLAAIAQAMEDDALANGDAEAVAVASHEEPAAAGAPVEAEPEWPVGEAVKDGDAVLVTEPYAEVSDDAVPDDAVPEVAVPEAAVPEAELAEPEVAETPAFVTETMGELLVAQGFVDRAVTVYEELVRRRPYDPVLAARLAELREQAAGAMPVSLFTARERFAKLAARRVARRTPARAATPVVSTAAIEAGRGLTPQAGIAVSTPVGTPVADPVAMSVLATPAYTTPHDSLAALFGAEPVPQDDFAAQALADAFAPLPLEDSSASAFEAGFLNVPAARTPTPAYGVGRQPTPVAPPPVVPTPVAPVPAETASGDFSFDRFFPDPAVSAMHDVTPSSDTPAADAPAFGSSAMETAANASSPPTGGETQASAADDLAQFSSWLKGLGNS